MTIDVIVPTYRRPELLRTCLRALRAQTEQPNSVIVVFREGDTESRRVATEEKWETVQFVDVAEPGVLAALRAGVAQSTADGIAITDDDAAPQPEWLGRLRALLELDGVGGAGGRDDIPGQTEPRRERVGQMTSFGRLIGNHHLGVGPPREVDALKGVNMAFRADAFALPRHGVLRGAGAEVHFELLVSRWAQKRGRRLVYDPSCRVDHLGAERHGADRRSRPDPSAVRDAAYNFLIATTALDRGRRPRQTAYAFLMGSRDIPGVGRGVAALLRGERETLRRCPQALAGFAAALPRVVRPHPDPLVTTEELRTGKPARRIAIVAHEVSDNGGMERSMAEAIRLAVESFEVHVFSTSLAEDIRTRVVWHRIRVPRRPAALAFLWFFMVCGARLRRMRADVVHTLGAIVPNRADVATVQFCHAAYRRVGGRLGPEGVAFLRRINTGIARWIALLAETWCYRPSRLKAFAAVSEGIVDELAHHYSGIPAAVTPNGVDTRRFAPNAAARQEVRVENGLDNGQVVALFVGGEWPRKGLELAIRGFAASRDTGGPARLWIVGRGDAERYAKLVAQLGLSDTVDFLGPRNNVERFLAGADIFVFPTLYEAFPLAVLEAAATGLAIVATPVNGVSELLRDGSEALLVQRDPDSIAAALSRLAREPELRRRLGAEARLRAGAYDWERSSASVIRLYENIISGGTP